MAGPVVASALKENVQYAKLRASFIEAASGELEMSEPVPVDVAQGYSPDRQKSRLTLSDIKHYPTPAELYTEMMKSPGWPYHNNREQFILRDRSLASVMYIGDFRVGECLPMVKSDFMVYPGQYLLVDGVRVGKRHFSKRIFRNAKFPLQGERACFTEIILTYLATLKTPETRLFPWSLKVVRFQVGTYTVKSRYIGQPDEVKPRISQHYVGTTRAWQIIKALFPNHTEHWLRAFGYNYDYDAMDHDELAVSDKTKADPRSLRPYLRRRYDKYPVR